MLYALLGFLLLQIFTPVTVASVNLKGVHPDQLSKYQSSSSHFTCLDGSKTIQAAQVNDDYCDCPDGSDEPGTAACPNSWFYCRNKGHEPKLLASQFVQDGICDCCDGADEPRGVCENTCHLAIAAEKEKLQQSIDEYKQALTKKAEYITQAKARREEFAARASTIDAEIEQQAAAVKQLEEEKDRLQQEHQEKEDAARIEWEAKEAAAQEARAKAEAERQAALEKEAQEAAAVAEAEAEAAQAETAEAAATTEDVAESVEGAEGDDSSLSAEELGRKIASQWTNDPEAAGHAGEEGAAAAEEHLDDHSEDPVEESWDSHTDPDYEPEHDFRSHEGYADRVLAWVRDALARVSHWWQLLVSRLPWGGKAAKDGVEESEELREARQKYYAEKAKLDQLEKFKTEAAQVEGLDLGAYDEYLQWSGRCLSSYETQFTYEACFFDKATQREGSGTPAVIGKWKGFEAGHTVAVFDEGDWCWQAPNRSLKLQLECSLHEKLYGVEEPSRCVYTGKLQTPAACDEAGLNKLEADLARLHQIEEEIKNEVVHDEL